jgi:Domain of unknown function (DUF3597)
MGIFDQLFESVKEMVSAGKAKAEEALDKLPTSETTTTDSKFNPKINEKAQTSDAKNWRTSIVDLMKVAGMDSSFNNRKELAAEFGISDYSGTADQNQQLHREVMKKIQARGVKLT